MDGIIRVKTYTGGSLREVVHPSYQALTYAMFLSDYNESVQNSNINIISCVYLHNYDNDHTITSDQYKNYVKKAPIFLKKDVKKLRNFIKQFIKYGDQKEILYEIEHGKN